MPPTQFSLNTKAFVVNVANLNRVVSSLLVVLGTLIITLSEILLTPLALICPKPTTKTTRTKSNNQKTTRTRSNLSCPIQLSYPSYTISNPSYWDTPFPNLFGHPISQPSGTPHFPICWDYLTHSYLGLLTMTVQSSSPHRLHCDCMTLTGSHLDFDLENCHHHRHHTHHHNVDDRCDANLCDYYY